MAEKQKGRPISPLFEAVFGFLSVWSRVGHFSGFLRGCEALCRVVEAFRECVRCCGGVLGVMGGVVAVEKKGEIGPYWRPPNILNY